MTIPDAWFNFSFLIVALDFLCLMVGLNFLIVGLKLGNIYGSSIGCLCMRCKNKKFLNLDIIMMHLLQKGFIEKYMCWFVYG